MTESQKKTFKVELPDIAQSRISATGEIGVGKYVDKLLYAMYEEDQSEVVETGFAFDSDGDGSFEVTLSMARNKKYDVLFFAYNTENSAFDINNNYAFLNDLKALKLKSILKANQEQYDAFIGSLDSEKIDAATTSVTLYRPFAQVNVATTAADLRNAMALESKVTHSAFVINGAPNTLNVFDGSVSGTEYLVYSAAKILEDYSNIECPYHEIASVNGVDFYGLAMAYVLAGKQTRTYDTSVIFFDEKGRSDLEVCSMPVQANYRTNVLGTFLTQKKYYDIVVDAGFGTSSSVSPLFKNEVSSLDELLYAIQNAEDNVPTLITITADMSRALSMNSRTLDDGPISIGQRKHIILDLNEHTFSSESTATDKNYDMFDVRGTLTVRNGTVTTKHSGENMGWNHSTNVFNVTDGGVLNLINVTAKNLGGSDMAFVAHLNNWGEVTLNVENSTLESTYIPVRVFNSGPDMNFVTIKNTELNGKYCFWVHNYIGAGDSVGSEETLRFNMHGNGNKYVYTGKAPILYGFANPLYFDAMGNPLVFDAEVLE